MIWLSLLLNIFMLPMALLGLVIFVQVAKDKSPPMDESNRINHIRLIWFALTRPELFVRDFNWLKHDELDNINKKG